MLFVFDGTGAGYCLRPQLWSLLSMGVENILGAVVSS
jgi:hypothetical protein